MTRMRVLDDVGSTTVEIVVLAPLVIALLCFVVGLGRIADTRNQLTGATRDAARAASLAATPAAARTAAAQAAGADLAGAGIDCARFAVAVDSSQFTPGGAVTVRVTCTTDLSAVSVSGLPGHLTLTATSTAPLDTYAPVGT